MSVFLCPIDNTDEDAPEIISVNAKHFNEAKDKLEEKIREIIDVSNSRSWEDFKNKASKEGVYIGNIYDKEEF